MEIKVMIVKRLCTSSRVRMFCQADRGRIQENDVEHIKEVFDRIFPPQVMPGKNQSGAGPIGYTTIVRMVAEPLRRAT